MEFIRETVSIPAHTTSHIGGFLVRPNNNGAIYPGVVVIHEAFGLNDNIKEIAERFAQEGFVALAVDLFAGRNQAVCMVRFFGGMFFNSLNHGAITDLKAALTYLANQSYVDSNRLGAVGYCMGGNFAVCWACSDERLRVVASYYGMNPRPLEAIARACPVVGSYPENDFTASHARKLDVALAEHKIPHDIKIYPGTGHSFANNRRGSYNEAATNDSWQRTVEFFRRHIGHDL
jgi:carboxymethylenebutenolidase